MSANAGKKKKRPLFCFLCTRLFTTIFFKKKRTWHTCFKKIIQCILDKTKIAELKWKSVAILGVLLKLFCLAFVLCLEQQNCPLDPTLHVSFFVFSHIPIFPVDSVPVKEPSDLLTRQKCLEALASLRHAKWFQVRLFVLTYRSLLKSFLFSFFLFFKS